MKSSNDVLGVETWYNPSNDSSLELAKYLQQSLIDLEYTTNRGLKSYVPGEELAVLELVAKNQTIKQQELAEATGKSIATIKRIMKSLQDKNYIRRESGKRYGKWEILV